MNNAIEKKIMGVFEEISDKFDICPDNLKPYLLKIISKKKKRKKTRLEDFERCMARKQDGFQCSRRRKKTNEYCGKHINNRPYGRIDNEKDENSIPVKEIVIKNNRYLIDKNNIIFNMKGDLMIGKLMNSGEIFYV